MSIEDYRLDTPTDAPMATMAQRVNGNSIASERVTPRPVSSGQNAISAGIAGANAIDKNPNLYDGTDAAVSIGTSTLAGAAAGAEFGPWGAVIGGGVAALGSSVTAWNSLRASKRRRAALEAIKKEQLARESQAAASGLREKANSDKLAALMGASAAYDKNAQALQAMMVQNENLKNLYVTRGY